MRLYIVSSGKEVSKKDRPEFCTSFDDVFAQRVIKHLEDDPELCTGCGRDCIQCRAKSNLDYSSSIAGIFKFPSSLLYYVDDSKKYLPSRLPAHDMTLAIGVHEDLLLALPTLVKKAGSKGIIIPIEDPDWVTRWVKDTIRKDCHKLGLECSFPKPFCSLGKEERYPNINKFIDYFRVGRPKVDIEVKNKTIKKVSVICSAPCGNTYYVAHNLRGTEVNDQLDRWVAKYWHSYPCVASMKMDYDLGDTILHKGGYIHYDAVHEAIE